MGGGSLQESLTSARGWVAAERDEDGAHHRVLELLVATVDCTEARLPTVLAAAIAQPHLRDLGMLLVAVIIGVTGFLLGGMCAGPGASEVGGGDVGAVTSEPCYGPGSVAPPWARC